MSRYDLTDFEWCVVEPLLPNKPRGVPRVDDRRVLNGIFWVLRSGAPGRDLPERYGPRTTCHSRFVRWRKAGIWDRIMDAITAAHEGEIIVSVVPEAASRPKSTRSSMHKASRSGSACPPGQTHDGQIADTLLNHLGPRTIVLAVKAYDADRNRGLIEEQGATPNIPAKSNRKWRPYFSKRLYRERNLIERFTPH